MSEESKSTAASLEEWFPAKDHPAFFNSFTDAEREQMLADDLDAGRSVPKLLTAIIILGVVLASSSVWLMS